MEFGDFVEELSRLCHHERVRHLIDTGRAALRGDDAARALLDGLARSKDAFSRVLALHAAFVTRDAQLVLAGLTDPSRSVRSRATTLVPLVCDDIEVVEVLETTTSNAARKRLLIALKRRNRQSAIDAFLHRIVSDADADLLELLPFGSSQIAGGMSRETTEHWGPVGWRRLVVYNGEVAARLVPPDHRPE